MKENMEKMIPDLARHARIEQQTGDYQGVSDSRPLTKGLEPEEVRAVKAGAGLRRDRVW